MSAILATFLLGALVAAAWHDLAVRRLPNRICLAIAAAGLILRAAEGLGPLGASLATAALLFAALFALFAGGLLGGGDVKLATAVALGLPPLAVWHFVVFTALAGGLLSLPYLIGRRSAARRDAPRGRGSATLCRVLAAERRRLGRGGPLPYGIAICASAVWVAILGHTQG